MKILRYDTLNCFWSLSISFISADVQEWNRGLCQAVPDLQAQGWRLRSLLICPWTRRRCWTSPLRWPYHHRATTLDDVLWKMLILRFRWLVRSCCVRWSLPSDFVESSAFWCRSDRFSCAKQGDRLESRCVIRANGTGCDDQLWLFRAVDS